MRIVSWNVNGIRSASKKGLLEWLGTDVADVLCVQETKASPEQLPKELREVAGYEAFWSSAKKRGYSGTAIYSKVKPTAVKHLGNPLFDSEGRVTIAEFDAGGLVEFPFTLICAYFPNSQQGGARLPYKLAFCDAMLDYCAGLAHEGRHIVLCGDYNIAHEPIDLARPDDNNDAPGFLPEERAWLTKFLDAGFVDTFRHFYPDKTGAYSWWSYRTAARSRNVGWRIDYFCVDAGFMGKVRDSRILAEVTGSDHCPVEIDLF
jgi:exodeoxyribonuclease-3